MTSQLNPTLDHDHRRECEATADIYRDFFQWRRGSGGHSVWLELVPGTAALVAPLALAERVLAGLVEPGPIIEHPGDAPWCVLLVQAAMDTEARQVRALGERTVGYLAAGHRVDLPPTRFADGPLIWRHGPALGQEWPSFSAVANAVLHR